MINEDKKEKESSSDADIQAAAEEIKQAADAQAAADIQQPQGMNIPVAQASIPQAQPSTDMMIAQEVSKIQQLVQAGYINPLQGQNLVNRIIKKACEMVTLNGGNTQPQTSQANPYEAFTEFEKEKPQFFAQSGRDAVLSYLKNSNASFDKDELKQISQLIETLEQNAVERYLQQSAHEKTLNDENDAAKSRLRANAQKAVTGDSKNRVFTREQIGKMSGAEFAKNERIIMEQLRKGLIR